MKKFEFVKEYNALDYKLISENKNEILYFDIETTGLSASRSDLYMIGYGFFQDKSIKIILLFNDDDCSEPEMLDYFNEELKKRKYLISYNGDTFDIPYMLEKYTQFEIKSNISQLCSVDIYKKIRKYKNYLHLNSMKQKDMEYALGINRSEFISGGDLINEYKTYIKTGSKALLSHLINHNYDDIDGLVQLTKLLSIYDFFQGDFEIKETTKDKEYLNFDLIVKHLYLRINYGYEQIFFNGYEDHMNVRVPLIFDTLKYYFEDFKNYYYLPLEDTAIHKSMAEFVDKGYIIKATKNTAFVKKQSTYIKLSKKAYNKIIKSEYPDIKIYSYDVKDNYVYIDIEENFSDILKLQKLYIQAIM